MPRRFTDAQVQAVRDAIDIVDLAGEYTRLERRGRRYVGLCPFQKEKTPSFNVDPDQGLYYCFCCSVGGDGFKLHMTQTGDDFPEAVAALGQRFGVPLPERSGRAVDAGPDLRGALETAQRFFRDQLRRSSGPRDYLARRQVPPELIDRYGLGFAPDSWDALQQALRGVPLGDLQAAGLVGRSKRGTLYDRFRNRLMFPIRNASGRMVGFGGRTLGDDKAKYVNTSETAAFQKSRLLYGLHAAKRELRDGRQAVLVEGYFDVVGLAACGIVTGVANMGTALTREQATLLARYVDDVVIAYDADKAGERAFERALGVLLEAGLGVRRAIFPDGHDPDSLRLEAGPEAVRTAIDEAEDGVWRLIARRMPKDGAEAASPQQLQRAVVAIQEVTRLVRDPLVRAAYNRRAAQHLGVPESAFGDERALADLYRGARPAADARRGGAGPRLVRSEEERALMLLLAPDAALPAADQMPPVGIFLDPACRNIYASFCAIYRERGAVPSVRDLLHRLDAGSEVIDRAAHILSESEGYGAHAPHVAEPTESHAESLHSAFRALVRRWQKRRLPVLLRDIRRAQTAGDHPRLQALMDEKMELSRNLHRHSDESTLW